MTSRTLVLAAAIASLLGAAACSMANIPSSTVNPTHKIHVVRVADTRDAAGYIIDANSETCTLFALGVAAGVDCPTLLRNVPALARYMTWLPAAAPVAPAAVPATPAIPAAPATPSTP